MYLKKFALSGVSKLGIFVLNLTSFAFILLYIYMCGSGSVFHIRIRIQKASEYGSALFEMKVGYLDPTFFSKQCGSNFLNSADSTSFHSVWVWFS